MQKQYLINNLRKQQHVINRDDISSTWNILTQHACTLRVSTRLTVMCYHVNNLVYVAIPTCITGFDLFVNMQLHDVLITCWLLISITGRLHLHTLNFGGIFFWKFSIQLYSYWFRPLLTNRPCRWMHNSWVTKQKRPDKTCIHSLWWQAKTPSVLSRYVQQCYVDRKYITRCNNLTNVG